MVRLIADFMAEPLSKLFANSLTTVAVPTNWRLSIIWPMYKKGDPEDVSSYHPVSLTSIISKIFERILKKLLLSFLGETRSISPHHHGFIFRRSCLSNLQVFEEAVMSIDVIYPDFTKAFDSDNHRFFWRKWSSSVLVMSSCGGLKHTFLGGSREYT